MRNVIVFIVIIVMVGIALAGQRVLTPAQRRQRAGPSYPPTQYIAIAVGDKYCYMINQIGGIVKIEKSHVRDWDEMFQRQEDIRRKKLDK